MRQYRSAYHAISWWIILWFKITLECKNWYFFLEGRQALDIALVRKAYGIVMPSEYQTMNVTSDFCSKNILEKRIGGTKKIIIIK